MRSGKCCLFLCFRIKIEDGWLIQVYIKVRCSWYLIGIIDPPYSFQRDSKCQPCGNVSDGSPAMTGGSVELDGGGGGLVGTRSGRALLPRIA